jgi:hypothetical protein
MPRPAFVDCINHQEKHMAFVNEHIPDADLQRIDFSKIMHPLHSSPIIIPEAWTIDRERDIALIDLGGGFGERAMHPHFFVLYWQGLIAQAQLTSKFIGNFTSNDLEVTWHLEFIGRLAGIAEEDAINTLKEALFTYGYISYKSRSNIKAIHFDFDGTHSKQGV